MAPDTPIVALPAEGYGERRLREGYRHVYYRTAAYGIGYGGGAYGGYGSDDYGQDYGYGYGDTSDALPDQSYAYPGTGLSIPDYGYGSGYGEPGVDDGTSLPSTYGGGCTCR